MFALVERGMFCRAFCVALISDMLPSLEINSGLMAVVAAMELLTGQAMRDRVEHITHKMLKFLLMLMAQRYPFVVSDGQLSEG